MSDSSDADPLERVVVDKDEVDRERLADAIEGIIGVDDSSGEPVPLDGYYELDNKSRFVARLLARRAALALDFIDEQELGDSSSGFADRMEPTDSTIKNYGALEFVENESEYGGYHIPAYGIERAIGYLHESEEENS